ncbi:porphobilinogen deaminase [Natrinema pellirubrum DSM 15624]|uniref:Hydroxymethylbilane synthase n=1 Tax=Natrinema pellirubrum (strain DSM 15624 / CIP 106293 / JCM 10476 / NCIMB 786 / 157) TaxID=797303 RepID=L0JSD1_NATP1|nr:hydroxymethylbilane synthase [Natrinema pellirubrum]AGB33552.1 porphobilinogen deaminase [Natrinema pellirubrum DSM 15624]ELY70651.1 porphobilinogen deaminase [Natrinema pellirubrum DSM 15624]
MRTRGTLRLATRGSALARRQASLVKEALEERRYEVELVTVETTGDQIRDELIHRLGKTGAFVRELDERVLEGDLDGAIHSMKDMPTEQPEALVTAGIPERGLPGDVLITPDGSTLEELPAGATVGTSSLRRRAQLLSERDDLEVEPLRGNVDTRLEKLLAPSLQAEHQERSEADKERKGNTGDDDFEAEYDRTTDEWFDDLSELERQALGREVETEYDAIVLAQAGLERSGLAHYVEYQELPTDTFVPAPGQGALAVTAPDGETAREIKSAIDHPRSRVETTVERTILAELGGGCIAPVGIYAILQGEHVHATVTVFDQDGDESVTGSRDLPVDSHAEAAREFARDLADRGAAELIEGAREDAEGDDEGVSEEDKPEGK